MPLERNLWFNLESVHEIEFSAFEDAFGTGVLTEETYRVYRNSIINLYKSKTDQYLSVTACRRSVSLDICLVTKIHNFLEYWGLINFGVSDFRICDKTLTPVPTNSAPTKSDKQCKLCRLSIRYFDRFSISESGDLLCTSCHEKLPDNEKASFARSLNEPQPYSLSEIEKLYDAIEKHGGDWTLIGAELDMTPEDALLRFLSASTSESYSDVLDLNGNAFQTMDIISQNIVNLIGSTCSSSLAATISRLKESKNNTVNEFGTKLAASLLSHELENLQHLSTKLVDCSLKRINLKIRYLEDLESSLLREKGIIERHRLQVFMERYNLKKSVIGAEPQPKSKDTQATRMDFQQI